MKPKRVAVAVATCVATFGVAAWWATRATRDRSPELPPLDSSSANVAADEPAPALELVGLVEDLSAVPGEEQFFRLRIARPDPPATESADGVFLRESFGVVHVHLRPTASVTGAGGVPAGLVVGQLVRVRSLRSQPKPTDPPIWFPDSVRVISTPAG